MTQPPIRTSSGRFRWTCDGCDKVDFWTETHMIYGSLRDEDEQRWERLVVSCSEGCRVRLVADGRVPPPTT